MLEKLLWRLYEILQDQQHRNNRPKKQRRAPFFLRGNK